MAGDVGTRNLLQVIGVCNAEGGKATDGEIGIGDASGLSHAARRTPKHTHTTG
jgi:hypothetical protein